MVYLQLMAPTHRSHYMQLSCLYFLALFLYLIFYLFSLIVFLFFQALLAVASGNRCNNKTDAELYDPQDHSIFNCSPALDCHDGYEPSVQPGSSHPKGKSVECKKCPFESFSNIKTKYRCQKCTVCGNKKVIFTCTPGRDRQCSNSCISSNFYFNKTDQQCHPCIECCGTSSNNIEPQCVSSQKNLRIGTVIGEKGALHCKVPSSQQCDELSQEDEVHVTPNSYKPSPSKKKCSRLLDATVIALICCLAVSLAVNLFSMLRLYVRGRQRLRSSHSSPAYFVPSFPCSSTSAGMLLHAALVSGIIIMESKIHVGIGEEPS